MKTQNSFLPLHTENKALLIVTSLLEAGLLCGDWVCEYGCYWVESFDSQKEKNPLHLFKETFEKALNL